MRDKLGLTAELNQLFAREKSRKLSTARRLTSGIVDLRGRSLVDFTAHDIYSYTFHPKVIRAAQQQLTESGLSSLSNRFASGSYVLHTECEQRLAKLCRQPAALLFNTKNQAILTLISCLLDERDALILSEELQGPYADVGFLVQADISYFKSSEPDSLVAALERVNFKRRKIVLLDVVSAYDGKISDVPNLIKISEQQGASLITDESYSFGFLGANGAGAVDCFKLIEPATATILDFSSLLGMQGAAICASNELISLILARSNVLATEAPLSPTLVAGLIETLSLTELAISEREKLTALCEHFSNGLTDLNFVGFNKPEIPVVTLKFANVNLCAEFHNALFEKGILADTQCSPKTRNQEAFVSFIISSAHSIGQINHTLEAISVIASRID